jgi:Uma2 family endonuclease
MAVAREEQAPSFQPEFPSPHLFTVDDYYRMAEVGVLKEDCRVELIDGVIFDIPPIGPEHASSVERACEQLRASFGPGVQVRCQNPVRLGPRAEPEPDVAVVRRRADYYRSGHPTPEDVLLLMEIADSTLAHDRDTKAPMYAAAGIVEYWLVNLVVGEIWVYRDPSQDGFGTMQVLRRDDLIRPISFPDIEIAVSDVLRPRR